MRVESGIVATPVPASFKASTLHRLFGLLSLGQRFMVVPLLALILVGALTAGFVYQAARQAALLDRVASTDLVELDLHAYLMNVLLVEHLSLHSMLQNAATLDQATLYDLGKVHLVRIYEAVHQLEQRMPKTATQDAERHASQVELAAMMQDYRRSVAAAIEVATVDASRLPPRIKLANERFGALMVGFKADQDERHGEVRTEIVEQVRQSRSVSWLGALSGVAAALLLLALAFGLSRLLAKSLQRQIRALADLGQQAGATVRVEGGDEVDRIEHAIAVFRELLVRLQRSEAEFRTLADGMPQIVWVTKADGNVIYLSNVWMEYTGVTLEHSMEDGWHLPFHPDDRTGARLAWKQATASRGILSFEYRLRRADGVYRWWLLRGAPMLDANGDVLKWFGTCTDIHDLKEMNADLEVRVKARTLELNLALDEAGRANRAKSDFLATMSHEIRTPMNGLLGLLELLSLSKLDTEQRSSLATANESGTALLHIIDDILDFSKIEANFLELDPAPASVKHVVEAAYHLHSRVASSKNLSLQVDVAADISPVLSFDAFRLGQILNNFLNNAIKFTETGSVDVSVTLVQRSGGTEHLRFAVRDTGIGISTTDLARLFQPFTQADAQTSRRFGGTGLGLVISKKLAELMGGRVEVQSEPGLGTTMSLTVAFPACEPGADVQRPVSGHEFLQALLSGRRPALSVPEAEKEGSLLLVVDDHPINRIVLLRQLASLGFAAEAACNGVEALEAFKTGRFGAVITDCNMPRMNGYQLATAIRDHEREHRARAIPIIGCTANALAGAAEACLSAGMDDCLVKPVDLADINDKLELWLPPNRRRRRDTVPATLPSMLAAGKAPSGGKGLLDHLLLHEITGGDARMQADMLLEFQRVNELDTRALRQMVDRNDFAEVLKYSHRIKGASQMLGATSLAEHCGHVEAASVAKNPRQLRIAMDALEPELLRFNEYVDNLPAENRGQQSKTPSP